MRGSIEGGPVLNRLFGGEFTPPVELTADRALTSVPPTTLSPLAAAAASTSATVLDLVVVSHPNRVNADQPGAARDPDSTMTWPWCP